MAEMDGTTLQRTSPRAVGTVRLRAASDVRAIREFMAWAYPESHGPEAVWSEATLLAHMRVFPEGQLVATTSSGVIVGSASSLRISAEMAFTPHAWSGITGHGQLTTHDPMGAVLYGVNVVVDPDCHGLGYARLLYAARIRLARRLGCRWIVAGARIPGYHRVAARMTPEEYVNTVGKGELFDPALSKQLKIGFSIARHPSHLCPGSGDPGTRRPNRAPAGV